MTIPAVSLLLASGQRRISPILLLIIISLLFNCNRKYFFHPTKKPFKELADYIKQEASNLTLINYHGQAHHLWESKYYGLQAPIYTPQPLPFYVGTALMTDGDIISNLPKKAALEVITSAPVEEIKISGYDIVKEKRFDGLKFLWLKKERD